jgi:hypothetical protein
LRIAVRVADHPETDSAVLPRLPWLASNSATESLSVGPRPLLLVKISETALESVSQAACARARGAACNLRVSSLSMDSIVIPR